MIIKTGNNTGIELQEYNGIYSLIAMKEYQGKYYQQWGRLEFGKDKKLSNKSQPFKVFLGNIKQARQALSQLLDQLCDDVNSEIPF